MSYYRADVGIVFIKDEYKEQFNFLFNGEYEKITDEIFSNFINFYVVNKNLFCGDIKNWTHENEKSEWKNKYKTLYIDGVFIFGLSYNTSGQGFYFFSDLYELLSEIGEIKTWDSWQEPI